MTMKSMRTVAASGTIALVATMAWAPTAQAAIEGNKQYSAYSHDIKVRTLGGVLEDGPITAAGQGCSDRTPRSDSNAALGVNLGGIHLGVSETDTEATKSGDIQTVLSTYRAEDLNVEIAGLTGVFLTAEEVVVTAEVNYDTVNGGFTTDTSMTVTNLELDDGVLATPNPTVNGTVAPNTAISFAGLVSVTLHHADTIGSSQYARGQMNTAISIDVLTGAVNQTSIGEVYGALYGATDQNFLFGAGEAVQVLTTDDLLRVGPLVRETVSCDGRDPNPATPEIEPKVTSAASLDLGSLGGTGVVESTALGTRSGLDGLAKTTSEVAGVDLNVAGVAITADAVSSVAKVTTSDGGQTVNIDPETGSVLTNLRINGVVVDIPARRNARINLPGGVGYVKVNHYAELYQGPGKSSPFGVETAGLMIHVKPLAGAPAIDVRIARSFADILGPNSETAAKSSKKLLKEESVQDAVDEEIERSQRSMTKSSRGNG